MREIPDPFTKKAHPCMRGSCLPELQTQLLVVFTAKTIGKQIANFLKPFAFQAVQVRHVSLVFVCVFVSFVLIFTRLLDSSSGPTRTSTS